MTILQINTTINSGSTGRIAEEIGLKLLSKGYKSHIAGGRLNGHSKSDILKIGNSFDHRLHGIQTRIFDNHGFASEAATDIFTSLIKGIKPDIIHLHNLHGYYIHVGVLFEFLRQKQIPIVWTLHDCWPFTGHCTFFDSVACEKWKTGCFKCPKKKAYPSSYLLDRSKTNYKLKRALFNMPGQMHIVTPSQWLAGYVKDSFLQKFPLHVIHNGVDLNLFNPLATSEFRPVNNCINKSIILGAASIWDKRKGLEDFLSLSKKLSSNEVIVLVGLNEKQLQLLPDNIIGIQRTENVNVLAGLYAAADVFVNPTWQDNFPTTNIEALACGTPVITYDTGGSPEAVDENTGFVVKKGDVNMLHEKISTVLKNGKAFYSAACRKRAEMFFNKEDRYNDYISLYHSMLSNKYG